MRIALGIEYNGTQFSGWQSQVGVRTVQDTLESALEQVANHPVRVVTAGRTDSGVHAVGQVVHFDSDSVRGENGWRRGTNSGLPKDVRVTWVAEVNDDFHARFSAVSRSYRYIIYSGRTSSAVFHNHSCFERRKLDITLMRAGAEHLIGEHDFSSFRAAGCQAKSPVRTIFQLNVGNAGKWFWIDVRANAFLQHMVRNIAGVLRTIGAGEAPPEWCGKVLEYKDRTRGGVTSDPEGLYLTNVEYPIETHLPSVPGVVRFWP